MRTVTNATNAVPLGNMKKTQGLGINQTALELHNLHLRY